MHPPHVRATDLELIASGHNDCQVARITGIPRGTIREWRQPSYKPRRAGRLGVCPRCWRAGREMRFTPDDYAELLGLYLGDGHIAMHPRTQRLRIFLDAKYPRIISETCALLARCFLDCRVGCQEAHGGTMKILSVYSNHLACLFPQHGPGKKHERPIELESWQRVKVEAAPWRFLKGCIRSDGCCFVNRTGSYEYLTYDFANISMEIVSLFIDACDLVGIEYRTTWSRIWRVRINRRDSVERLVQHVGVKD